MVHISLIYPPSKHFMLWIGCGFLHRHFCVRGLSVKMERPGDWRGGSMVKSHCCSCREYEFSSQNPHNYLYNSNSDFYKYLHAHGTHICVHKHTHIFNRSAFKQQDIVAREWWHLPLIPGRESQRQGPLWFWGQLDLQRVTGQLRLHREMLSPKTTKNKPLSWLLVSQKHEEAVPASMIASSMRRGTMSHSWCCAHKTMTSKAMR